MLTLHQLSYALGDLSHFSEKTAQTGDQESCKTISEEGNSCSTTSSILAECLATGVVSNQANIVKLCLQNGCDPNQDFSGFTPLALTMMYANMSNMDARKDIVSMLITSGADVNRRESRTLSRRTPLLMACSRRCLPLVELLVERGALVNVADMISGLDCLQLTLKMLASCASDKEKDELIQQTRLLLSSPHTRVVSAGPSDKPCTLTLAICTSQTAIITDTINCGHLNFHPQEVSQAIDSLSKFSGSVDDRENIYRLLISESSPESLQSLSRDTVWRSLRRQSRTGVSTLPCPHSTQKFILKAAKSASSSRSNSSSDLKELAFNFLNNL